MKKVLFLVLLSLLSQNTFATHGPELIFVNLGREYSSKTTSGAQVLSDSIENNIDGSDCLIGVGTAISEINSDALVDDVEIRVSNYLNRPDCVIKIKSLKLQKSNEISFDNQPTTNFDYRSWSFTNTLEVLQQYVKLSIRLADKNNKRKNDASIFINNIKSSRDHE